LVYFYAVIENMDENKNLTLVGWLVGWLVGNNMGIRPRRGKQEDVRN
jgi:hypothetical protein